MTSRDDRVASACKVIREAVQLYGLDNIGFSFNGGKDCTVLLHLLLIVAAEDDITLPPLKSLYLTATHPFKDQDDFINETVKTYNLDLFSAPQELGFRAGLAAFLKAKNVTAVLVGTRSTDPYCETLSYFNQTDPDWPQCMRVHPIIDWDYADIWDFLLSRKIPYCSLYDQGYTSLGGTDNTVPNPALRNNLGGYDPAHMLNDGSLERNGRL